MMILKKRSSDIYSREKKTENTQKERLGQTYRQTETETERQRGSQTEDGGMQLV